MEGPINYSIFLFGYLIVVVVVGYLIGVLVYLVGVLGYIMGVLGYLMAWRRRQITAKWRWGANEVARGPIQGPCSGPRHFLRAQRHLEMAWRRRQAIRYPKTPIIR